jgi:hypothetical protein
MVHIPPGQSAAVKNRHRKTERGVIRLVSLK